MHPQRPLSSKAPGFNRGSGNRQKEPGPGRRIFRAPTVDPPRPCGHFVRVWEGTIGMKRIFGAATALCLLTSPLPAQDGPPTVLTEQNLSPMATMLVDFAQDGCWTDPPAAEAHLRQTLRGTKIELSNDPEAARTTLVLQINAKRTPEGCYGAVHFSIFGSIDWQGAGIERVVLESVSDIFYGQDTIDAYLLEEIERSIPALAEFLPDS